MRNNEHNNSFDNIVKKLDSFIISNAIQSL